MAEQIRSEWNKQGDLDHHARFHKELPPGVTLSSPTAELHERTSDDPETWVKITSGVTITPTVVNALDNAWVAISGGTNRAVRVVITKDPDAQPNVADEPTPGDNYRIMIIATRSDSSRPIARDVPLVILP